MRITVHPRGMLIPWLAVLLAPLVSASAATPVVDGHNHEALTAGDEVVKTAGLEELEARGIQVVVVPLPVERSRTSNLEERIAREIGYLRSTAAAIPGFAIPEDPAELLGGVPKGEIRVLFSMEWFGGIFGSDVSRVSRYRALGVRMIGLAGEDPDGLFGSGEGSSSLSSLGEKIIAAMNEAGVVIDITHLTHAQKLEVIARSRAPVVASHSLVRAVTPESFNLPEEVLAALAEHGGSVWVSFNRSDLLAGGDENRAIDILIDHIDALVARLGAGRVGIGSDLQAGGKYVPAPLNQRDTIARIRTRLHERGHAQQVIEGILGGNILRALANSH